MKINSSATRNTMQKSIVLETVRSMHDHPTADMVYGTLHKKYPTISKATVYRLLGQLSAKGEILKIPVPGGADCYDFNTTRHYHIRCTRCGAVGDVKIEGVSLPEEPYRYMTDSGGYIVTGVTVMFNGICHECAEKNTDSEEK